jgi:hypothetical protein
MRSQMIFCGAPFTNGRLRKLSSLETTLTAASGRLSVRLRSNDLLLLRERAAGRDMPTSTYASLLIRAHLRTLTPLPTAELTALRRSPQTKPRRVAGVLCTDQVRRWLLCTLRRVPNLRRSFDARFLHRALQLRRCGKRFRLLEAVEVMSDRDIIWIVDRLVHGLGNDAHFLLRRAKPIVRLLPCGVIRDFVTNKAASAGAATQRTPSASRLAATYDLNFIAVPFLGISPQALGNLPRSGRVGIVTSRHGELSADVSDPEPPAATDCYRAA